MAGNDSVRAARARFFARNGWPQDGGYDEPWAEAVFGTFPYRVPNTPARRAALRVHDLHHVLTGYDTDWRGEAEISAWELGGGPGRLPYAWFIAVWGLFTGLLALPVRTFAAFVRGRRSANLLGRRFDPSWLDESVADLRAALPVARANVRARASDALWFGAWSALALALGVVAAPFALVLVALAALRSVMSFCPWSCACTAEPRSA